MSVKVGSIKNITKLINKHAWSLGIRSQNDYSYRAYDCTDPILQDMDCFFQFNVFNPYRNNKKDRIESYNFIINSNKPYIVWEEGAFRKYPQYKKVGWWHYQNSIANFNNYNVTDSRWQQIKKDNNISIKDFKSRGDKILIMSQLDFDSALIPLYNQKFKTFYDWVIFIISEIRKYTDRPIVFRPHPFDLQSYIREEEVLSKKFKNVQISKNYSTIDSKISSGGAGLLCDLNNAYCAVTFNSNSAVESIFEGIPTFALHNTSPIYDIALKNISEIESISNNTNIDAWCSKVAYTMWTANEIKQGKTWAHLKPVYFN